MKKTLALLILAAFGLACQSQAAVRWSLKYTYGHHRVNAIITTGDFYSDAGGYPIIAITGERDGVKIIGLQHGYDFLAPWAPRTVLIDTLDPNANPATTLVALFDNLVFVNGQNAGFDYFGLSFNAGGLEYNVYSDGVTNWEMDSANNVATSSMGEVVTHFEIRQLPKERDDDDCGHGK